MITDMKTRPFLKKTCEAIEVGLIESIARKRCVFLHNEYIKKMRRILHIKSGVVWDKTKGDPEKYGRLIKKISKNDPEVMADVAISGFRSIFKWKTKKGSRPRRRTERE